MSVISITITESEEQILEGIPKSISISTNIISNIFYTLDGSDPTLFSSIYLSPIFLPTAYPKVILKVLATDGMLFSDIATFEYETSIVNNARLVHSATDAPANSTYPSLYPFGDNPLPPNSKFLNPADAGVTVNNPELDQIPSAYNADGYPDVFTNEPFTMEYYNIKYSTSEGGPGIGTLPAEVIVEQPTPIPEETKMYSNTFDPRALVIFQDVSLENPSDPPNINRILFSLENLEGNNGNYYYNTGLDSPPITGSFVRSFFNPKNNTITYYYFDSRANRWIISKTPYNPLVAFDNNLSKVYTNKSRGRGHDKVFEWINFTRRVLF